MEKKIVARNKLKGTRYIYAEICKNSQQLCEVVTENVPGKQPYLVPTDSVEFLPTKDTPRGE